MLSDICRKAYFHHILNMSGILGAKLQPEKTTGDEVQLIEAARGEVCHVKSYKYTAGAAGAEHSRTPTWPRLPYFLLRVSHNIPANFHLQSMIKSWLTIWGNRNAMPLLNFNLASRYLKYIQNTTRQQNVLATP